MTTSAFLQAATAPAPGRIVAVSLETASLSTGSTELDIERRRTIADLLENGAFLPQGAPAGDTSTVTLGLSGSTLTIAALATTSGVSVNLQIDNAALSEIVEGYSTLSAEFYTAAKSGQFMRMQDIDRQRRRLQADGGRMIAAVLVGHAAIDAATAERFFTLFHVLHVKATAAAAF